MIRDFVGGLSQKMRSLKQLYALIRKYGPLSKSSLIEMTGLKHTTCARLIEELMDAGLIMESGLGKSNGGRKPLMYQIQPDFYYVFGIDISRLHTKVVLMNLRLDILEEAKLSMDHTSTPESTIEFIEKQITCMMAKHKLDSSRLLGIGIGAVGPIDREHGMMMNPIHFSAGGWENVPVVKLLSEKFNTLVLLDNGANTAVLGEYQVGLWKELDTIVYNITGIGIRCGVLTHGQVVRGPVDMEEAYGHIVIDIHGRPCECGHYGCLNTMCTILAIKEEVLRRLKRGHSSLLRDTVGGPEEIEFSHICWAVGQGDPLCSEVVKDSAYHYGIGLSNLIYLIHPQMIILGGALVTELDLFYQIAVETVQRRSSLYPGYEVEITRGTLGERAVAVGAGSMILDYYIS